VFFDLATARFMNEEALSLDESVEIYAIVISVAALSAIIAFGVFFAYWHRFRG
jgi:hypothetical protein